MTRAVGSALAPTSVLCGAENAERSGRITPRLIRKNAKSECLCGGTRCLRNMV
jgi:hypothetical protein